MPSTPPIDDPQADRRVVAMRKEFEAGAQAGPHSHPRAQFAFAVRGVMLATTRQGRWVVPPGFAFWVPAGITHEVSMHGAVSMRTAYIRTDGRADERIDLPSACQVLVVSPLLEAALVALCEEDAASAETARGGLLAALVLDEIARAPVTPFALPVPSDRRLARLAQHLIDDPASPLDLDAWSAQVGVSRRTLTRRFRTQTGLSFGTWRRRLRLLAAALLIAGGEAPARAALRVGYRSLDAFQAMAKRELGTGFDHLPLQRARPLAQVPDLRRMAPAVHSGA